MSKNKNKAKILDNSEMHNDNPEFELCNECVEKPAPQNKKQNLYACHADECANMINEGNDGFVYVSRLNKKGTYHWVPMIHEKDIRKPPTKNTYYIHDNGKRPFKVIVSLRGKKINIYKCLYPNDDVPERFRDYRLYELSHTYEVNRVLIGNDPDNIYHSPEDELSECLGNSILAEITPTKYLYIGECVYEFRTSGPINIYRSPVGNNDVPYPFAVDKKFAYLMIENVKIPISELNMDNLPFNPYADYYKYSSQSDKRNSPLTEIDINPKIILPRE